jgi:large subunit ribosomal protein L7Ae
MASYVDLETPKELVPQILEMLSMAKDSGKIKKGVNETTKSIERKSAKLVVVAEDVTPEEIVIHIPMFCKENGIIYAFVPTKKELGGAVGIIVGTSAVAVENPGGASEKLQDIMKKMPRPTAAKAEAPAAVKREEKPQKKEEKAHKHEEEHKKKEEKKEEHRKKE